MSTIQYIPPSLSSSVSNLPISSIFACAHPPNQTGAPGTSASSQMTNHWVLHCVLNPNESLRIDPSPSGLNFSLVLIISKKTYAYSHNAVKTVQVPTPGLTLAKLLAHVTGHKYDKYQFASGGQGCRFWVSKVIELLRSGGYIQTGAECQTALNALNVVWGPGSVPLASAQQSPVVAGRFL